MRCLRVHQWLKNAFIFAPLVFGGELFSKHSMLAAIFGFLSFSLLASAVYVINDLFDREADRQHEQKRARPIASGLISLPVACSLAAFLFIGGISLAYLETGTPVVVLELVYVSVTLGYSFFLKHVVILDVFCIAIGFVIRVLVGASCVDVIPSHWLLLCTFLLALFLGLSKRMSELKLMKSKGQSHRRTLGAYTDDLIKQFNVILCASSVVSYVAYTVAPETITRLGTDSLIYTVPFVLYGLFRYLYLIETRGEGGNPSLLLLHDLPLGLNLLSYAAVSVIIIYR